MTEYYNKLYNLLNIIKDNTKKKLQKKYNSNNIFNYKKLASDIEPKDNNLINNNTNNYEELFIRDVKLFKLYLETDYIDKEVFLYQLRLFNNNINKPELTQNTNDILSKIQPEVVTQKNNHQEPNIYNMPQHTIIKSNPNSMNEIQEKIIPSPVKSREKPQEDLKEYKQTPQTRVTLSNSDLTKILPLLDKIKNI